MKLIMENWRRYIVESKLKLDENQMQPKFLREFVMSEGLIEEDKDPDSLSVQELANMKPQQIISAYENMKKNETGDRIAKRISRYKALNDRLRETEFEMSELKWTREEGGPSIFTNFFDSIKKITNAILRTSFKTSKEKEADIEKNYDKSVADLRQIMLDAYSPIERELFRAISIFTGGHYPAIRDPDAFDPKKAKALKFVNDGIIDMFQPSKETYEKAKVILQKLVQSKIKPVEVWRGLSMKETTSSKSRYAGLDLYKKGNVISVGNLSSFSTDKNIAYDNFMEGEHFANLQKGQWGVILYIPKLTRGADVDEFSQFEDDEVEIIVSGKFRISKVASHPRGKENERQEGNSLQDLLNSPNPPRYDQHVIVITLEDIK